MGILCCRGASKAGGVLYLCNFTFAASRRAKDNHTGAFVWCDSLNQDGASQGNNTFTVRASGGTYFFSSSGNTGVHLPAGSGSWTTVSGRNANENLEPVNSPAVLEKVAALPLSSWNYNSQDASIQHVGPMAQDFRAAFGLGEDDKHIATVHADGVALAVIQGLNQKLETGSQKSEDRIQKLETENAELKQAANELEELLQTMNHNHRGAR